MSIIFDPSGILNVAADPSDLPESSDGTHVSSDALTRAKNVRLNEKGKAKTRDGSTKLNETAINTAVWWLEEQGGTRYAFAGTAIYANESSIATGLTSAQWTATKYKSYNDTAQNIFALNGTDRKRIESSVAYEWGIAAPTDAPTLTVGQGTGLTGLYSALYTYVRKVSGATVSESNPSPAAISYLQLTNQSLAVSVTASADAQVTHIRLYRTTAGGAIYYWDQDIPVGEYTHGVAHEWEDTDNYLSGNAYKFTIIDSTHSTNNTYTWEEFPGEDLMDNPSDGTDSWFASGNDPYTQYIIYVLQSGGTPLSFEEFLELYG